MTISLQHRGTSIHNEANDLAFIIIKVFFIIIIVYIYTKAKLYKNFMQKRIVGKIFRKTVFYIARA